MPLVTLVIWFAISLVCIYFSARLVTGRRPDDWNGMFLVAILIPFFESLRFWVYFFTFDRELTIWFRIIAGIISIFMLYVYAHLRLGLDEERKKLLFATLYPGVKLLLYLTVNVLLK
jgi:hypothetical protein